MSDRRLVIDTDTAGDDTMALLMAALTDRATLEAVTVVAGNVAFDRQVENAKYTLDLAGVADDVPVHEGARSPLEKDYETADYVHGEGGLGGDLLPETGIPSADEHAVDYLVRAAREEPGELTLACIGPLTNVALALEREPDLGDLLDEVWVMGGAVNGLGNVTPAAEYNFWVDPDAARRVVREIDLHLVDWRLSVERSLLTREELDPVYLATGESPYADFFTTIAGSVREFTREQMGVDGTTQPDSLTVACLVEPDLVTRADHHHVDVDHREGLTRGYSLVDEGGVTGNEARTRVVHDVDRDLFHHMFTNTLVAGDPHAREGRP